MIPWPLAALGGLLLLLSGYWWGEARGYHAAYLSFGRARRRAEDEHTKGGRRG